MTDIVDIVDDVYLIKIMIFVNIVNCAAVHFALRRFTTHIYMYATAFMSRLCNLTPRIYLITNIILFCRNLLRGGESYLSGAQPIPDIRRNNRRIRDIVSPGTSLPETSTARTDEPLARTRYYLTDKVSAGTDEQIYQLGRMITISIKVSLLPD